MKKYFLAALSALLLASPAFAAPKLANQTIMTFDPGHGTQVEYDDASGATYLWYPGNRVVLSGQWKLKGSQICYRYGANTYNPVTGAVGAVWECQPVAAFQGVIVDKATGDVFGLRTRKSVPFSLPAGRTTIAKLSAKLSGNS